MTHKSKDDVHPHFLFTTFRILTYFVGYVSNNQFLLPRNILNFFPDTEFECPTSPSFRETTGRLCMSFSLACNGLPNCGDNQIPNPDESCYKVSWLQRKEIERY